MSPLLRALGLYLHRPVRHGELLAAFVGTGFATSLASGSAPAGAGTRPLATAHHTARHAALRGLDDPPNVSFTPDPSAPLAAGTHTITVRWCDDGGLAATSRQVTVDGQPVSSTYAAGAAPPGSPGCAAYAASTFTLTLAAGQSRVVAARIRDNSFQSGADTVAFTGASATAGGAGLVTLVSPTLLRDPGRCALDCGEVVQTHATPAYVSRDVARGLALVYRSGRAAPRPVVEVDVAGAPAGTDRVGLALRDAATGAAVPLVHGATEVVRGYTAGATHRLAAQFTPTYQDQTDFARRYTVVVTAYAGTTALGQTTDSTRVVVDWANGPQSRYGAGWGLAGVSQWRWTSSNYAPQGGLVIVDGDGMTGFWRHVATAGAVSTFAAPPGDASAVTYDASTGLLTRRFPDGTVVRLSDAGGNTLSVTDRLGSATTFGYDAAGRLATVTDPANRVLRLAYRGSGPGEVAAGGYQPGSLGLIEDPGGRQTWVGVDGSGDLRRVVDPRGDSTAWHYDGAHRLTRVQDPRGGVWDYMYDGFGTLLRAFTPAAVGAGGAARASTDYLSWARAVLTPFGQGTPANPAGPLAASAPLAAAYDNGTGLQVAVHVDRWGAADRTHAPGGVTTTVTRDANGNVTRAVDARGQRVDYVWNAARPWLLDSTYDAGARAGTRYTHDPARDYALQSVAVNGQERQRIWTRPDGRVDSVRAGGTGQPVTGYRYTRAWDPRPDTVIDARGHRTEYTYATGGLQNLQGVRDPGGGSGVVRDAYGRDSVTTDATGRRTVTLYDVLNRPTLTVGPGGDTTRTAYDALFPRTVTDAVGQVYRDSVNALGAPVQAVDPAGQATQTAYDAAGRVSQTTNRRGQTVTLAYDPALGTLASRTTSDGFTATYASDALGRWAAAANAEAADTVYADSLGRDTLAVRRFGALPALRYLVRSAYDSLGRRVRRELARTGSGASGRTFDVYGTHYGYNATGPIQSVSLSLNTAWSGGGSVTFGYNTELGPSSMTLANGIVVSNGLTAAHQLGARRYWHQSDAAKGASADVVFGHVLARDSLGRVTRRLTPDMMWSRDYRYDAAGRLASDDLKRAPHQSCTPVPATTYGSSSAPDAPISQPCAEGWNSTGARQDFAWDRVGNPRGAEFWTDTTAGNLLRWVGQTLLNYDADGNITSSATPPGTAADPWQTTRRLSWNALGQLTGAWNNPAAGTGLTDSVTFGYDAGGARARKTNVTAGTTRYSLWDAGELLAELDAGGDLVATYAHHPGAVDVPLMVSVAEPAAAPTAAGGAHRVYYYALEAPGHVAGLLDAQGNVAATYGQTHGYPAFGQGSAGPALAAGWRNPLQYGAREYDAETGLYYQRARYYDPRLRRFVSRDPVGLAGGVNEYAYAGGDPVNATDPSGLSWECFAGRYYAEAAAFRTPGGVWSLASVTACGGGGGSTTRRWEDRYLENGPAGWNPYVSYGNPHPTERASGARRPPSTGRGTLAVNIGDTGAARTRALPGCIRDHYGLPSAAVRGVTWGAATPLYKPWLNVPVIGNSSAFTNPVSYVGLRHFPGTKMGVRVLGTNRVFGLAGRANVFVAGGLALYDAVSVWGCALREN